MRPTPRILANAATSLHPRRLQVRANARAARSVTPVTARQSSTRGLFGATHPFLSRPVPPALEGNRAAVGSVRRSAGGAGHNVRKANAAATTTHVVVTGSRTPPSSAATGR